MKILYDLKKARTLTIWMSIGGILFALAIADEYFHVAGSKLFSLITLFLGGAIFFVCGYFSLSANLYIGMLKRYGFEVPDDLKKYDGKLANLKRDEETYKKALGDQLRKSKTSTANCVLFAICYIGCIICNVMFYRKWSFMSGSVIMMILFMGLLDLIWLVMAIVYFLQRSRKTYRDLVEIDETRKPRTTLPRAIMNVCILLALTFVVKYTVFNLEDHIFRTCMRKDQVLMCDLQNAIQTVYEERIGMSMEVDNALSEGVEINESWDMNTVDEDVAAFWDQVLLTFNMHEFRELLDSVNVADGSARIFVVLKYDTFEVELLNPVSAVDMEIKSTGLDEERPKIENEE